MGAFFRPPSLKRALGYVPVLDRESGHAERWILQAIDGKRSLEDIAIEAARRFTRFSPVEDAFNRAAEIAEKYSR